MFSILVEARSAEVCSLRAQLKQQEEARQAEDARRQAEDARRQMEELRRQEAWRRQEQERERRDQDLARARAEADQELIKVAVPFVYQIHMDSDSFYLLYKGMKPNE